ncbi:MAG: hypothetical protein HRU33_05490 [Rhodobacteraceae bacterium]|nr:hypothetical protein [Paracoccaceae bacterium]
MKKDKLVTGIFHASYLMGAILIVAETLRRGFAYWGVHATTIIEDYISGAFLIIAAVLWFKRSPRAGMVMAAAWAYMIGMMTPTFFSHFEAHLRGVTRILDQPYDDVGAIAMKGVLWLSAVIGLGLTLYCAGGNDESGESK